MGGAREEEKKYAVKTCALSSDKHIQNERKVLNELGQNRGPGSPNEFLSILEKELELNLELSSYKKQVAALLLSPRGIPLLSHLSSRVQKVKQGQTPKEDQKLIEVQKAKLLL